MFPAALLVCAGCQMLAMTDLAPPAETPEVETAELEQLLAAGQWEVDREWSVLELTAGRLTEESLPFRWHWAVPATALSANSHLAELHQNFPGLSVAAPSAACPPELAVLSGRSTETGWSAAILCSRNSLDLKDSAPLHDHAVSLLRAANTGLSQLPASLLAAAAETWCRELSRLPGDADVNFASAGRLLEQDRLAEDIRAELFRGIARKIAPRQIPGLNEVMVRHESARIASPLHLAAVEACVLHAWHRRSEAPEAPYEADRWPDGLLACRFSEDVTLRKLYGRWAALAGHPEALAVLKSQRLDSDLGVREAAVISLGFLDDGPAHEELLAVMAKGTDPERVAAIVCLARAGTDVVLRFVRDDSPKVRAAIAGELGRVPSKTAAITLADLLQDRSPEVQLAALEACRQPAWQDAGRIPLLLQALRVGVLRTRMTALSQLRQEWGQEPEFPVDGTAEVRELAVRKLAQEHDVSAEVFTAYLPEDKPVRADSPPATRLEDVRRLLQEFLYPPADRAEERGSLEKIASLEATAVPVIEQELNRASGPRAEQIYRDVLPKLHPAYVALTALEQPDAAVRRQAARDLHDLAEQGTLSPNLLRRLSQRMASEQDRRVWQDILAAILPDALPEAAHIALVALNSPWPDIRLLGCDYFERHPQPEYAAWLLPRLQDADHAIRLRSIRLLARCGNPIALDGYSQDADANGLRQFLADPDQQLRWEAVVAMSRLGDVQATQELIRQAYDSQPRQRELAVQTMGQTGQAKFLEPLLRRSWTETDRGVQRALLKALDELAPADDRPGLAAESSISDKIREWARWWEQRQRNPAAASSLPVLPAGSPRGSVP